MTRSTLSCLGVYQDLKAPQESGVVALAGEHELLAQPTLDIAIRSPRFPMEYLGPDGWQGHEHWWRAASAVLLWNKVACIGMGTGLTQHMEPGVVEFGVRATPGHSIFLRIVWPDRLPPFDESTLREAATSNHILDAQPPLPPQQPPPPLPPVPPKPEPEPEPELQPQPPQPPQPQPQPKTITVAVRTAAAAAVAMALVGGVVGAAVFHGGKAPPDEKAPAQLEAPMVELTRLLDAGPVSPRGVKVQSNASIPELWKRAQDADKVKDEDEAVYWLRQCSLKGDRACISSLGYIYLTGQKKFSNIPAGLLLYQVSGLLGDKNAFYNLGAIYEDGELVNGRNNHYARYYYQKAKEMGHSKADTALERLK